MPYVDSHCHLHDSRILSDLPDLMARAGKQDVRFMASCATMEENFELTLSLSETYDAIIPFFGVHPWFLETLSSGWKEILEACLSRCRSGIGETGLDFMDKRADRELQIKVFEYHLMLAREMKRPINIHIRKAWDPFIRILKKNGKLPVPGLVHSFSGSADMIPVLEKFGLFISFSGSVTRPNARKVVKALNAVSEDRLLMETDSPDIYPSLSDPASSGLNEPANLPLIAKIAAQRIGRDAELLVKQASENSRIAFEAVWKEKRK